jgi:hypothetical protein
MAMCLHSFLIFVLAMLVSYRDSVNRLLRLGNYVPTPFLSVWLLGIHLVSCRQHSLVTARFGLSHFYPELHRMFRHLSFSHYASRNVCYRIHNTVTMTISKPRLHKQISFVCRYGNWQRFTKKLRSRYCALWHIAIVNWLSIGRSISNLVFVIQTCFGNWLCFRHQI